jgi:hypothetical protein
MRKYQGVVWCGVVVLQLWVVEMRGMTATTAKFLANTHDKRPALNNNTN